MNAGAGSQQGDLPLSGAPAQFGKTVLYVRTPIASPAVRSFFTPGLLDGLSRSPSRNVCVGC